MQKRTIYTGSYLLWLTGLLFFLHGVIPHHHYEKVIETPPATHTGSQLPGNKPVNCRLFNELFAGTEYGSPAVKTIIRNFPAPGPAEILRSPVVEDPGRSVVGYEPVSLSAGNLSLGGMPVRGSPSFV